MKEGSGGKMRKFIKISLLLALFGSALAERTTKGRQQSSFKRGVVLSAPINDGEIIEAEQVYGPENGIVTLASPGLAHQDQAFVVSGGYKVADGVLDGSFGGVTHTAKGIRYGYDHEGPHHGKSYGHGHGGVEHQSHFRPEPFHGNNNNFEGPPIEQSNFGFGGNYKNNEIGHVNVQMDGHPGYGYSYVHHHNPHSQHQGHIQHAPMHHGPNHGHGHNRPPFHHVPRQHGLHHAPRHMRHHHNGLDSPNEYPLPLHGRPHYDHAHYPRAMEHSPGHFDYDQRLAHAPSHHGQRFRQPVGFRGYGNYGPSYSNGLSHNPIGHGHHLGEASNSRGYGYLG